MTTKRWGSLAMRENSDTNSRNLGRHSESIIQPRAGESSVAPLSQGQSEDKLAGLFLLPLESGLDNPG